MCTEVHYDGSCENPNMACEVFLVKILMSLLQADSRLRNDVQQTKSKYGVGW